MPIALDAFAARLPEIGTPARHAFLLVEISGVGVSGGTPYRGVDMPDPAARHPHGPRAPLCLALAIDASGSMRGPRFAIALQAARDLIDSLAPNDRVLVVTFDRAARLVMNVTQFDPQGKADARRALDRLTTASGTNLAAGWRECADALSRIIAPESQRRILLLTDGLPSVGERSTGPLAAMIAEGKSRGIETSVVGIGDAIDDALCVSLARAGDGRFYYLRNEGLLADVVAHEVEGARRLAATDLTLVLALSARVQRAEVLQRFACQADGRTLEVRVGAVSYESPRAVLLQLDLGEGETDAVLGAAVARGRAVVERKFEPTAAGYALGARSDHGAAPAENDVSSPRVSLALNSGPGHDEARRRIAAAVLVMRTLSDIRSAWDGFDAHDHEAVVRRLGRARELGKVLREAGLIEPSLLDDMPDLDVIESAMLGHGASAGEARRTFASWAHNTLGSQPIGMPRKREKS